MGSDSIDLRPQKNLLRNLAGLTSSHTHQNQFEIILNLTQVFDLILQILFKNTF